MAFGNSRESVNSVDFSECLFGVEEEIFVAGGSHIFADAVKGNSNIFYSGVSGGSLAGKKYWQTVAVAIGCIGYGVRMYMLISYARTTPGSYTALYSGEISSLIDMLAYYLATYVFYFVMLGMGMVLSVIRIAQSKKRPDDWTNEFFLAALTIAGLAGLMFFRNKGQPYYFFPVMVMIVLYFFRELNLTKMRLGLLAIVYLCGLALVGRVPQKALARAEFWQRDYVGDGELVKEMLGNLNLRRYSFSGYQRGEYPLALSFIYRNTKDTTVEKYEIEDAGNTAETNGKGVLCGRTFWNEKYCRWRALAQ